MKRDSLGLIQGFDFEEEGNLTRSFGYMGDKALN
jgi:hypothetical protein